MDLLIQSPSVDHLIDLKLEELKQRPEGKVLSMVGLEPAKLKPLILPFIGGFGNSLSQISADAFGVSEVFNAENLRKEIDNLMTEKLKELTPQAVKALLERVIRHHLGWLIVWGNVFGGIIGIISKAAHYS
ncbi:hypothetical protein M0811_13342 [Anaeramoeba ignava]|uniref:DUF445 family protein n=1 Tax=Anaeramoeba ignava TaxID=1746090 RepID=A0A9Q0L7Y6_ANAIG|nr:hypothetical protein M0811_13342 [Anaeramoeba ignava]